MRLKAQCSTLFSLSGFFLLRRGVWLFKDDAVEVIENLGAALDGLTHDGEHDLIMRATDYLSILDLLSCLALS
jgi:hypothetical protein